MSFRKFILAAAAATVALAAVADDLHREHRSIWMSPFLGSNWPSSAITAGNAESHKRTLRNRLDKFQSDGINVLYYHVRSFCDANYRSNYEPWSNQVSTARGVEPAFDPLEYLIEQAHMRGIEVYAWINPYRYCNYSGWGDGELNYENSHPDWLLRTPNQIILNPGIPEVVQRIADVATDIVTNFDVDGIIFDDYFYSNPTGLEYDADLYNAYKARGGTMDQYSWRRANVNSMVAAVNAAVKQVKPWVVFGISPAGTSSPTNVETEYGLPPGPYGDWQYNGIASDPLAWLKAGTIDFISPQIYWPNRWLGLNNWWSAAAKKFGRHFYPSTDLDDFSDIKTQGYIDQIDYTRTQTLPNESGYVFFQYGNYVNGTSESIFGSRQSLGENLHQSAFANHVLTPLRSWDGSKRQSVTVAGLALSGTTLQWTEVPGMRYAIYAIPNEVATPVAHPEYLCAVRYTNSYEIPEDLATGYTFAVAVYDRFGNEYAAVTPGAQVTADAVPTLASPVAGAAPALFDFRWTGSSETYVLEVAEDADFRTVVSRLETRQTTINSSLAPTLAKDRTYYWRVTGRSLNRTDAVSATGSFNLSALEITAPVGGTRSVELMPTITWTPAEEGSQYTLEISRDLNFNNNTLTYSVDTNTFSVPDFQLQSGRHYYARVTAANGSSTVTSSTSEFYTVDIDDYPAPAFANPSADGQTLYSDQPISLEPWRGMYSSTVYISESDAFPSRSSFNTTLTDFATDTPLLGNIKLGSKPLEDGKTYCLRARGTYYLTSKSAAVYTDYTPVWTFVYSSASGITDATDAARTLWVGRDRIVHATGQVEIWSATGHLVARVADGTSLANLPAGVYLLKTPGTVIKWIR